jgi:hypothetical protein
MAFNITGYGNIDGFTNLTQLPGLPTVDGCPGNLPNNSVSVWFDGYAVFPTAGSYNMVIASDDGFRLTEGIGITRQILHVSGASVSMDVAAVPSTASNVGGNWLGQLPLIPITAPIEYVDTNGCPCAGITNNLTGKIALIDGNRCGPDGDDSDFVRYVDLVSKCQEAGAIAVIVQASPGWGTPEVMGGGGATINIPALHIFGFNGLKEWFHTNGPLTATFGADANLVLGEANYGKGANDIGFTINVPQAGVYPLHLTYEQGGGGAALVWYTVQNGNKILVNDPTTPGSVLFYRARTAAQPTISISRVGSNIRIDYVGRLLSSTNVKGPYNTVIGATSPYIVPAGSPQAQFYRTVQN